MDIELISAELRPRRPWEAVDLGVSLCRRHLGRLLLLWSVSVLPLIAMVSVLLWNHFVLLVLVVWWLKPLYDRVPLYYLSRVLFGSAPTLGEFFRALPKLWSRRIFDALVVGRFSLSRSFVLPVKELEGLTHRPYAARRDILLRSGVGESHLFIALCLFLELFFTYGLVVLVVTVLPVVAGPDVEALTELALSGEFYLDPAVAAGVLASWILVMTFIEHIYVAGGFGLYLNARTELEGWDVELAFRRIAQRVCRIESGGMAGLLAAIAGGLLAIATPCAQAADPAVERPDEVIERVLEHEDFEIHYEEERVLAERERSGSSGSGNLSAILGPLGLMLFWTVVVVFIVAVAILIYKNRHYFARHGPRTRARDEKPRARTVLGMEIDRESLPEDIVAAARRAWDEGRKKQAVSLLYRGAISWLVESAQAPVRESDTESDFLRHARANETARSRIAYIEALTGTWIGVAYGRREPVDDEMAKLLHSWPFNTGGTNG